jgi:hypothetical protein
VVIGSCTGALGNDVSVVAVMGEAFIDMTTGSTTSNGGIVINELNSDSSSNSSSGDSLECSTSASLIYCTSSIYQRTSIRHETVSVDNSKHTSASKLSIASSTLLIDTSPSTLLKRKPSAAILKASI